MYTKNDLIKDLKKLGINETDTVMVHSSLRSVGEIEGGKENVLHALMDVLNDGLLLFPTHTWSTMKEDGQVFDVLETESCVGALTNIARKHPEFKRSNHPTHSVCAWGRDKEIYVTLDDDACTPTPPKGCFGALTERKGKILFLGASLTKNTFVHSVEEYMDVPLRFTEHVYHFITKNGDETKDFHVVRHYNEKCPHISDNYIKLLQPMLDFKIAVEGRVGDAVSYLVDAKGCFDLTCYILKQDIQALSDMRDITPYIKGFTWSKK